MEKEELFKIRRENTEWLKENYESLTRKYNNRWIMIQNKKVAETACTFNEIMNAAKKYDTNKVNSRIRAIKTNRNVFLKVPTAVEKIKIHWTKHRQTSNNLHA